MSRAPHTPFARISRLAAVSAALALVSGCGIFGNDEDEELQPKKLVDFETSLEVNRLWSQKVGGGSEFLRVGLAPAGDGNRVYAASYDGRVNAFDPETGRRI